MQEPVGQDEYGSTSPFDPDDLSRLNAIGPGAGGNDFEKYAVAVIIVFGALVIGGADGRLADFRAPQRLPFRAWRRHVGLDIRKRAVARPAAHLRLVRRYCGRDADCVNR